MARSLVLLLLLPCLSFSQNYVINGGFERTPANARGEAPVCSFSGNPDLFNNFVQGWQTYFDMTPDLLVADSTSDCPLLPRRGVRMIGLIMYHPAIDGAETADYHELIQGTLAKPLEKGKTYRVWFWTRAADTLGVRHLREVLGHTKVSDLVAQMNNLHDSSGHSNDILPVHCGNFGLYFSTNKISPNESFMQSQSIFPVEPQLNWSEAVETPGDEWRQISFWFKADQPYRYFLFGNFFFDAVTPTSQTPDERARIDAENLATNLSLQKTARIAYYCFDDFVVEEWKGDDMARTLLEQKKLSFDSDILFDLDQATLKPGARAALDQLAGALKSVPNLRVEIGGHTDNSGDAAYNQQLSERRALAVQQFLLERGIDAVQLSWRGYGETQPIASNDTGAGRQKNRRVEILMR